MPVYSSELTSTAASEQASSSSSSSASRWHLTKSDRGRSRSSRAKAHSMKAINTYVAVGGLLFVSVLGGLVGLVYLLFDPVVKHVLLSNLVLTNDTQFAEIWKNPPIAPHLKVYFFNFTNPEQFFAGEEKPRLEEIGPYTYSQKWIKENVAWHSNGTMSYSTRKIYTFRPEHSFPGLDPETDLVVTANVPLLSAYYQMRAANFLTVWGLNTVLYSLNYKPWVTKTPSELVWGYEEPLFEVARYTLPNPPDMTKFGYFTDKNNSASLPLYTMFTGEGNPYNLSKISLFNGKEHLDFWKTDQCNKVQGSDGATYNPYIHKADTLWFFNDQLCRSIPMIYQKSIVSRGLPGYRFSPRPDVFLSPRSHPENDCYCVDQTLCDMIGDGMFPISACQFDAPIALSWPHFLRANSSFLAALDGVSPPREDLHGFWFDVQPVTGTTLSAKARLQVNIAIKATDTFEDLAKIGDTILPVLWFEEGLDELGDGIVDAISGAITGPPMYKNYILCVLLGLAVATLVISLVACVRLCANHRDAGDPGDADAAEASAFDAVLAGDEDVGGLIRKKHHGVHLPHVYRPNHADMEVLSESVRQILKPRPASSSAAESGQAGDEEERPMLAGSASSSGVSTQESSRVTSASHSRNTSTGSNALGSSDATVVVVVSDGDVGVGDAVATADNSEQLQLLPAEEEGEDGGRACKA